MFARKLEFDLKLDKKDELLRKVRTDVMPVLRRQRGFIDILGLVHEMKEEKVLIISLWREKKDFELYEREVFPKVHETLKPYLLTTITMTPYNVETTISEKVIATVAA